MKRSVAAGAGILFLIATALALWHPWSRDHRQLAAATQPIAVLPFENLGAHDQEYLADAVTDDLAADLANLPGTRLIARRSTEKYRGHRTPPDVVARVLAVRTLIEGDIRTTQADISIDAYLIDAQTGNIVLTEREKRPIGEMQAVQASIARRMAAALHLSLDEDWRSAAERDFEQGALDRFLAARAVLERDPPVQAFRTARPLLETAVAVEPNFLEAIDLLSRLLLDRVDRPDEPNREADLADAGRWIARALAHAPDDSAARANKGRLLMLSGQYAEAVASFRAALPAEPGDVELRNWLAISLRRIGHPGESIEPIRDAIALSPEDPDLSDFQAGLASALLLSGQAEEAERWFGLAAAGRPAPVEGDAVGLIAALAMEEKTDEARTRLTAFAQRWPHRTAWRVFCRLSRAEAQLPAAGKMASGLIAAGMPEFASEAADDGIEPAAAPQTGDAFAPTPVRAPGVSTILSSELAEWRLRPSPPLIVDIGCGAAVIPGALFLPGMENAERDDMGVHLRDAVAARSGGDKTRPVVVVGSGVYGWGSHDAALALAALGYGKVSWFRGGEEAWAAAHLPAEDRRDP